MGRWQPSSTNYRTSLIEANKSNVNYWFTMEEILQDPKQKQRYYSLMGLAN